MGPLFKTIKTMLTSNEQGPEGQMCTKHFSFFPYLNDTKNQAMQNKEKVPFSFLLKQ